VHVERLRAGVRRWLRRVPHRFVCLTDLPPAAVEADEVLPLLQGWPGWWSKLELFDGRLRGPVFYLDLDTIITGPLDDIVLGHRFTVLENFWSKARIGSGLMAWNVELRQIVDRFRVKPGVTMRQFKTTERWGDQGFIYHNTPVQLDRWQGLHPGKVVSFKLHCRPAQRVPQGASVVCFHGKPRPWSMSATERAWFGRSDDAREVQSGLRLAGP